MALQSICDGTCNCGCGTSSPSGKKFISGHNLKVLVRTEAHRRAIGEAQRRAWQTKRQRKPIGSKNIDHHGYVRVKVVRGSGRWEKEHKLVAQSIIGRALLPSECVHHINGIKTDNRPENLFVCTHSQHSRIEQSCRHIVKEMLERGLATFNAETGEYKLHV